MKSRWQRMRLRDACAEIFAGGDVPKDNHSKVPTEEHQIPIYTNGEKNNGLYGYTDAVRVTSPSITISARGTIGYAAIRNERYYPAIRLIVLIPKQDILDAAFLFYTIENMEIGHSGTSIPQLTVPMVREFAVSLPPLPEQKRIACTLDKAFNSIATAKANAEKNLQNARAILDSHLQAVFSQRGEGWVEKKLKVVCNKITDGTHHSPKTQFSERGPGMFPYITSKNIRNNKMNLSNVSYIERVFHDEVYSRCKPSLGDILLTKDGANTGNVALNTLDEPFSLLSSVCLIKTNQAYLKPAFLCFYLQSSTGLSSIVGQMTGAAIKRIVLRDIKEAVIPFPPLKEQDSIVTTLNSLLAETQRLESIYRQKVAALDELKKSLLNQAFSGDL